jgi:hypothetical protein
MANINIFRNPELLPEVGNAAKKITVDGAGGKSTEISQVGYHPLFGEVWFHPDNDYNIISEWQAEKMGFRLVVPAQDQSRRYLYRKSDETIIPFERDPKDKFWKAVAVPVREIKKAFQSSGKVFSFGPQENLHYTQDQLKKMSSVKSLHEALDHPGDEALAALLQSPSFINSNMSVQDLKNLRANEGPCSVCAEGKPIGHSGSHSGYDREEDYSNVGEMLHVDIVFINKEPRLL